MTIEIALLLAIVGAALVLFSFEWVPADVAALGILLTLIITGLLPAQQGVDGAPAPREPHHVRSSRGHALLDEPSDELDRLVQRGWRQPVALPEARQVGGQAVEAIRQSRHVRRPHPPAGTCAMEEDHG